MFLNTIFSFLLSVITTIGGFMTSDTVASTAFVPTRRCGGVQNPAPQQQLLQRQQPPAQQQLQRSSLSRERSLSAARHEDTSLGRRRVLMCKYFSCATLLALVAAVAAWDYWPLLYLVRLQYLTVLACFLAVGPVDGMQLDYIRVPMTIIPWIVMADMFFFLEF